MDTKRKAALTAPCVLAAHTALDLLWGGDPPNPTAGLDPHDISDLLEGTGRWVVFEEGLAVL